jgi:hypothetical protein
MASLAAIWMVVRVISWHGPANIVWDSADPADGRSVRHAAGPQGKRWGGSPLPVTQKRAPNRQYRPIYIAARHPLPERSSASGTRPIHPPWPYSGDVQRFFLQASQRRSGKDPGDGAATISRFPNPSASVPGRNLTAYFWIHTRHGLGAEQDPEGKQGGSAANGQYGGSQAGALLSYRLFDRPAPDISVYGRVSAALAPLSQGELALGARIRPLFNVPLAVHAEQRFDVGSGDVASTAIYATGGTGPDVVIERFVLETYAQAGYVLGRNQTYFFDGSATVQRPIADFGGQKLSVGAGLWTGGQRDIRRLDVGPRANLDLPLGAMVTRIAIDGRIRVAGNAQPGNGAALTVSTSF